MFYQGFQRFVEDPLTNGRGGLKRIIVTKVADRKENSLIL